MFPAKVSTFPCSQAGYLRRHPSSTLGIPNVMISGAFAPKAA